MIAENLIEAVAQFGTPVYVYDQRTIRGKISAFDEAMTMPFWLLFAVKSNFNPVIFEIIRKAKTNKALMCVDAVSPGEVALALKTGWEPRCIVFTGNNASDEEVRFAVDNGVMVTIDSLSLLRRMGRMYPGARVWVRFNTLIGAGHHSHCITGGPKSKFGIWRSQVDETKRIAKRHGLKIVGAHQHIGSQILNHETLIRAANALLPIARQLPDLEFVDFGGGFGVPYRPEEKPLDLRAFGRAFDEIFSRFCEKYGKKLTPCFEPGRFLVAESGILVVRVTTVKKNPDGRVFVGVDSGFNHLIRPAMYGSYHYITNLSNPLGPERKVTVVGNLCESGDKLAEDRSIPNPREGDILAIHAAGAYGFSMSSNYNLRPRPPEVLIRFDGTLALIRERETVKQLLERGEV
jgi:diaminopimelate decarboxylase